MMTASEYLDCLHLLYGRLNYERQAMPRSNSELRLGRMKRLLQNLGDPDRALKIVHVAGTKGKGSTASMIAAALQAAGHRVGLFCSPHLHRLEERFQIDQRPISPESLVRLTDLVRPAVARLDQEWERDNRRGLTFFEVTTAMGLLHFAREGALYAVLEVGMGGRLDSTNAVRPSLSVITSISLDHTRQLGTTPSAIAAEKAGIIKRGRPVVSGVQCQEARAVINRIATQRKCRLFSVDNDFSFSYRAPSRPLTEPQAGSVIVRTWRRNWRELQLPLFGPHQALNAATALASLDALAEEGLRLDPEDALRGIAALRVPARFEILGRSPYLVIDGAHNAASAQALAQTLADCVPDTPRTLLFGTTRDKDLPGQLHALVPLFHRVIATRYQNNPRSVPPSEIARCVAGFSPVPLSIADTPAEAIQEAYRVTPAEGLICVAGSLFLAAEIRALVLGLESGPEIALLSRQDARVPP